MAYTVANPHPGFGTDPNILNELGHSYFPKWEKPSEDKPAVLINSLKEYKEIFGKEPEDYGKHLKKNDAPAKTAW